MSGRNVRSAALGGALIAAGNLGILVAVARARRRVTHCPLSGLGGAENALEAGDRLLRSGRPGDDGYLAAAGLGIRTIVDLRAEGGAGPDPDLGLDHVRIPIRDGQPPSRAQVTLFRSVAAQAPGRILVHCAAGVGRTGSLLAAYEILERGLHPGEAARRMLAVGPPSLEQIAFVLGGAQRPPLPVVALSRVLDAPRRTWSRIRARLRRRRSPATDAQLP